MNDNTFKLIVIICLVAIVSILGVSAYSFINDGKTPLSSIPSQSLQNTSNSSINVNTTQNIAKQNNKQQTSTHVSSTGNQQSSILSPSQVQQIINQQCLGYGLYAGTPTLFYSNGKPYYKMALYDKETGKNGGQAVVDAKTGNSVPPP